MNREEWILFILGVGSSALIIGGFIYCFRLALREPSLTEIENPAFDDRSFKFEEIDPDFEFETPPPCYEEATGGVYGLRQRTSRQENATPNDVIFAGREVCDAQGSGEDAVGAACPSGDGSEDRSKDSHTEL